MCVAGMDTMTESPTASPEGGARTITRWRWLGLGAIVVLAAALGMAALLATAAVTAAPVVFLSVGLLVFVGVSAGGIALATRRLPPGHRERTRRIAFAVGTLAGISVFCLTMLVPLQDPRLPPAPVDGLAFWDLPTGSRIAYAYRPAAADAHRDTPVVFIPGGPGVADMRGDLEYFGQLTRDGFDVYVYDTLGVGRSTRLDDPRGYTLERDVADLAAIREQIGAERLILIGHSYGAVVAAAFLAQYPDSVERVIFSSPGGLYSLPAAGGNNIQSWLTTGELVALYRLLLWPRATFIWGLVQINPQAAHALGDDPEMDARYDRVYNRTRPSLHCRGKPLGDELHGLGFYTNSVPRQPWAWLRPALAGKTAPALVIKGSCDYLTWDSAIDYLRTLPNATLAYLPDAGHNAYQDQPERFLDDIRAFLLGESPPDVLSDTRKPADYEGPD